MLSNVFNGLRTSNRWNQKFRGRNFVYGRVEAVDRDRFELVNKEQRPGTVEPGRTNVKAATFGYVRNVPLLQEAETGLGGGVTFYRFDASLDPVYGENPVSFQVFLRLGFGPQGGAAHHHESAARAPS